MHFFIYEWDNSQRKRKTVYESFRKELVLCGLLKHIDDMPHDAKQKILQMYYKDEEELELEKNANS
jgi:GR25 family glycosyltransferase involved in LPS biosynthesis